MLLRERLAAAISAFTEFAGRLVAPATPWLFLALRRALIPTTCWVILACFFFVVAQSREVLHGLSEAPLASIYDFHDEAEQRVNTWSLLAYAAMSVIVSFVVWYSARLLSAVDSANATPPALVQVPASGRLACAMVWLPRILGVSALAACIGALIYANYTPQLRQLPALALAVGAVGAPLLVAFAAVAGAPLDRVKRIALGGIGLVVFVVIVAALWRVEPQKWGMKVWSIALSVLPALLLVFLVKRRELFIRMKLDVSGMSATAREFGSELVTILIMLACSAIALLSLAFVPPPVVRGFGSAATVLLFLTSAVLLLTGAQLVLRRIARDVPGFTTATIIAIAILVLVFGHESLGTEKLQPGPRVVDATPSPSSSAGQRIYVSAFGGGIRAAIFTAEVLAQADDTSCGEFGSRIDAMSGVSGGSLGIATYLIARQSLMAKGGWKECVAGSKKSPLTEIATKALVQDHLSAAIARMLSVDVTRIPGSPKRGQALLDSWDSALVAALETDVAKPAPLPGLAVRMADLTGGIAPPPRVYFNATDADTGNIAWFSNRVDGECNQAFVESYPVGQAVLHSARFPIVTPAGEFAACETFRRLVDGGYADNSGATTLQTEQPPTESKPLYIVIDGNPPEKSTCEKSDEDLPPLPTAVGALLEARQARAELAVKQLTDEIGKEHQIRVQLDVERVYEVPTGENAYRSDACEKVRRTLRAPLGWYVSYGAARTIAASAQLELEKIMSALAIERKQVLAPITPPK